MAKNARNGGPDLLALAIRRARDDVAAGRVPKRTPEVAETGTKGRVRPAQAENASGEAAVAARSLAAPD